MYKAFLSYAQLKEYLTVLLENGLLEYEEGVQLYKTRDRFFADVYPIRRNDVYRESKKEIIITISMYIYIFLFSMAITIVVLSNNYDAIVTFNSQ
jgi:hypothetical protein